MVQAQNIPFYVKINVIKRNTQDVQELTEQYADLLQSNYCVVVENRKAQTFAICNLRFMYLFTIFILQLTIALVSL